MEGIRIGSLASRAGVGVETVRFYERKGLLREPPRTASGYRAYDAGSVARLRFIRRAKGLGFTLKEIEALLALRRVPGRACSEVKEMAKEKIGDLEDRIRGLTQIKAALERLAVRCDESGPSQACPFLEALQDVESQEARA